MQYSLVSTQFVQEVELCVVALFVLLLIIFFAAFFGFDLFAQALGASADASAVAADIAGFRISVSLPALHAFLGGGIVFCEFIIIAFSVFDRIIDTIRALIKPIATFVPLAAFLASTYRTFKPIVDVLLPPPLGSGNPTEIATAVASPAFNGNVLLTFGTMVLYLITTYFLSKENSEVKQLRAEVAKLRKQRS